jgi:hypothetical protein
MTASEKLMDKLEHSQRKRSFISRDRLHPALLPASA